MVMPALILPYTKDVPRMYQGWNFG